MKTKPEMFTVEQVANAIKSQEGNLRGVHRALKCSRGTVYSYIRKYPELQQLLEDEREDFLDTAESELQKLVKAGNFNAIAFVLKTQGKKRGYTEKQEIEVSGYNVPVDLNEKGVDAAQNFIRTIAGA